MDAQAAWLQVVGQITMSNKSHPIARAKFVDFQEGVITLQAGEYVQAALEQSQSAILSAFAKHTGVDCQAITFTNKQTVTPEPAADDTARELEALRRELRESNIQINRLNEENRRLKQELSYHQEWGGAQAVGVTQDGVFIPRETLKQVAVTCLDKDTPRTAAPLFLYILSLADTSGNVDLEAKTVCTDLLGIAKRSWAGLLGGIFGTLILRNGHQLKVTLGRYQTIESNTGALPTDESIETESNTGALPTENSNTGALPETPKVTTGRYSSHVIMNGDDINKKSSMEGSHHSRPTALDPETQKRLDQRQRELHAMQFNPEMAQRYHSVICFASDETWASWLEQAKRGRNPAGLMCGKIKAYFERGNRIVNIHGKAQAS